MILLSGELNATKTYTARTWYWVGRTSIEDLADGTLTVTFTRGTTRRAGVESRRYLVQEVPADVGRQFLFLKADGQADPAEQDIYAVTVLPRGVHCTCKAASCKAPGCIHSDIIPELIVSGAFDPTLDPADPYADSGPTEIEDQELPECFKGVGVSGAGCPF